MCTVTYLPKNNREFILTSNRDEDVHRATALPFKEYEVGKKKVHFPKDMQANGSWIATDASGYTLCLLNGAYEPHMRKDAYSKSRGIMLLDFYTYNNPQKFATEYNFDGIEPFTLLLAYSCSDTDKVQLHELKWNEKVATLITHDSTLPHIWSSVTLYKPTTIAARQNWFNDWIRINNNFTTDGILFFHHFGGSGIIDDDLLMNRGAKRTVSVSCINKALNQTEIIYEDIINQKLYNNKIISC